MAQSITPIGGQYADEEVPSAFVYPKKYEVKPLAQQIDELRKHFPELSLGATQEFIDNVLSTLKLPEGAEGWFAIPRWERVAKTYNEAVERILKAVASQRKLINYRRNQLGPGWLRQSERVIEMWQKIGEQQKGDILIVPAQFGMRHRGRSVRRARVVFMPNEFGFGAFAVGCMLLTHPERLEKLEDLCIDCVGDEYDFPDDVTLRGLAPYFAFHGGELGFAVLVANLAFGYHGASSGFALQ